MKGKRQHIQYFLFSQYLADGIRITLEIILPAVIASQFGRMDIGLMMSTGALCVSMTLYSMYIFNCPVNWTC
jgi:TRAP-type C4-dicarboxylate transport system permease small subunit